MAIVTSTVTINAAFLHEIKEDNRNLRLLQDELEALMQDRQRRLEHRRYLAQLLGRFRDQLAMHFALEEAFGYFDDPVSVAPRLSNRADQLRLQHATLFDEICRLVEEAETMAVRESSLAKMQQFAERLELFQVTLRNHETAENDLILEAFDEDIGVGD